MVALAEVDQVALGELGLVVGLRRVVLLRVGSGSGGWGISWSN